MATIEQIENRIVKFYRTNPKLEVITDREYIINGKGDTISPVNLVIRLGNEWARLIKIFDFEHRQLRGMSEVEQRDYIAEQCLPIPHAADLEKDKFKAEYVSAELCFFNTPESTLYNIPAMLNFNGLERRIYHDWEHVTYRVLDMDGLTLRSKVNGSSTKPRHSNRKISVGSSYREYAGGGDVK